MREDAGGRDILGSVILQPASQVTKESSKKNITIALAGNPNCGKTTLFNALTGDRQKIANWPGVTVKRAEGVVRFDGRRIKIIDLPGTYSLVPYSLEEKIVRECMEEDQADIIINVIDSTSLERSLYLTMQLAELGRPVLAALNMADLAEERGIKIDLPRMSAMLGISSAVPISARKHRGLDELLREATMLCSRKAIPERSPERNPERSPERNPEGRPANHHRKMTAAQKYDYIDEVLAVCVSERAGNSSITDKADSLLTHPAGGFVLFLIIMAAVFFLTFAVGDFLKGYFQGFLTIAETVIRKTLAELHVEKWMISLIVDGAVAGVGGVLTFLPNLVMLFLALAILEDSGYMARAAYVMDDVMSQAGLSGKAFLPLLLGFGCTVPAIMAAGILEKPRDRRRVILIAPFISCSARLPIYVLFAEMFFPGKALEITYLLYLLGLGAAFFTAFAVHLFFKTEDREHALLIELPEYRFPSCRTVGVYVWERTKDYLGRAGTTIFIASAAVWLLMNLGPQGPAADVSESFAAIAGHALAPFLIPAGLGIWQVAVALISGLAAKEVVISSFCVLFGIRNISSAEGMAALLSQLGRAGFAARNAGALMVFCLLYSPCAAAAAVIRRETGSWKWTLGMAVFQTAAAWVGAVIVYQAGGLIFG